MTSSPDHSDFQDYAAWAGPGLADNGTATIPALGYTGTIQWVGAYASMLVIASEATQYTQYSLNYFADSAGTTPLGQLSFSITPQNVAYIAVPNLGPYVRVEALNTGSGSSTIFWEFTPSNLAVSGVTPLGLQNIVDPGSVSYGAGTTTSYVIPFVQGVTAHIHLSSPTVSGVLVAKLSTTQTGLVAIDEVYGHAYTGFLDDDIVVPDVPLLLQVQNTDTAAHSAVVYYNGSA